MTHRHLLLGMGILVVLAATGAFGESPPTDPCLNNIPKGDCCGGAPGMKDIPCNADGEAQDDTPPLDAVPSKGPVMLPPQGGDGITGSLGLGCSSCADNLTGTGADSDLNRATSPNNKRLHLNFRLLYNSRSKKYDGEFGGLWDHIYNSYLVIHQDGSGTKAEAIFHKNGGVGLFNAVFENERKDAQGYTPAFDPLWNTQWGYSLTEMNSSVLVTGDDDYSLYARFYRLSDQEGNCWYYIDPEESGWDPDTSYDGIAYLYKMRDIYGNVLYFERERSGEPQYPEPGESFIGRLENIYELPANDEDIDHAIRSLHFAYTTNLDDVARVCAVTREDNTQIKFDYIHDTGLGHWILALIRYPDQTLGVYDIGVMDVSENDHRPFWEMCDNRLSDPKVRFFVGKWTDNTWDANGGIYRGKAYLSGSGENAEWQVVEELTLTSPGEEPGTISFRNVLTQDGVDHLFTEDGSLIASIDPITNGELSRTYGNDAVIQSEFADGQIFHYHYEDIPNRLATVQKDYEYGEGGSEYWTYFYPRVLYSIDGTSGNAEKTCPSMTDPVIPAASAYVTIRLLASYTDRAGKVTNYTYGFDPEDYDIVSIDQLQLAKIVKDDHYDSTLQEMVRTTEEWSYFSMTDTYVARRGLVSSYYAPYTDTQGDPYQIDYTQTVNEQTVSYGFVTSATLPTGRVYTQKHNILGWLLEATDPCNRTWTYQRDAMGRITQTTYPDGSLEKAEYDAYTSQQWNAIPTDPGDLRDWIVDKQENETDPIGSLGLMKRRSKRYYPEGIQSPFVAEDPVWTGYTYDAADRVVAETVKTDVGATLAASNYTYNSKRQLSEVKTDSAMTVYIYYDNSPMLRKTAVLVSGTPGEGSGADRLLDGTWQVTENAYEYQDEQRELLTRRLAYVDTYYVRDEQGADSLHSRTVYIYSEEGQIVERKVYSVSGGTQATTPLSWVEYDYDRKGNLTTETVHIDDENTSVTSYDYDAKDRLIKVINPDETYVRYWYDNEGRKIQERNEEGHDFYWTYDDDGRLATHTAVVSGNNSVNQTWAYSDDSTNKQYITTMTNVTREPDSVVRKYEGCCGRIYKVEQTADGDQNNLLTTTTYFTGAGQLRYTKEPSGKVTKRYYDGLDRVTEVRAYTDDESSYITNETYAYQWAAGFSQTVGYKVTRTDAASRQWVSKYDGFSRLDEAIDPVTYATLYYYDEKTDGDTLVRTDVASLRGRTVDRLNREDRTYRDMAGRTVRKVEDALNLKSVTDYDYDLRGLLTALNAYTGFANGQPTGAQVTGYAYDSRGRLITETLADGHVKNYWYYPDSALMATREQRSTNVWIGVVYIRDQLNRVLNRYYYSLGIGNTEPSQWGTPTATDTFSYEDIYDRVTATGSLYNTYVRMKRNDLGQILQELQRWSDNVTREVDYSYRQAGNKGGELLYVYYPSGGGNRVQWQYDMYHRPMNLYRRVSGTDLRVGNWSWNNDGTPLWYRRGNSIDTTYEYDTVGRQSRSRTVNSGSTTIFDQRYEYDKEGNRLTQRITTGETNWDELYTYDTLYRLGRMDRGHVWNNNGTWVVSNPNRTEDWALDLLGNWDLYNVSIEETISQDRSHNVLNQIERLNPLESLFTYDLQGNLTDDGSQKYVWDVAGRLKQVWTEDGETLKEESQYDAYGRRVKHWIYTTSDSAYYYYDGWRVIEEWVDPDDDDAFLQARNVWGLYLDEMVVRWAHLGEEADQDFYPVLNTIYSPLRIYDGSGNLEVRMKYTPYGKPLAYKPDESSTVVAENIAGMVNHDYPHLFTGQRHDVISGLYCYKERYQSPSLGRFLSQDRLLKEPQYRYAYVLNSPAYFVDSYGLKLSAACDACEKVEKCGICNKERCIAEASAIEAKVADIMKRIVSKRTGGISGNVLSAVGWGSEQGCVDYAWKVFNALIAPVNPRDLEKGQIDPFASGDSLRCWVLFIARSNVLQGAWGHNYVVILNLCSGTDFRFDPWGTGYQKDMDKSILTQAEHGALLYDEPMNIDYIYDREGHDYKNIRQNLYDWVIRNYDCLDTTTTGEDALVKLGKLVFDTPSWSSQ